MNNIKKQEVNYHYIIFCNYIYDIFLLVGKYLFKVSIKDWYFPSGVFTNFE